MIVAARKAEHCIAIHLGVLLQEAKAKGWAVLQYNTASLGHCAGPAGRKGKRWAWALERACGRPGDRGARQAGAPQAGGQGVGALARQKARARAGQGWLGGLGAAWVRCWPTGGALGALGLFLARFDSVLFLSH